MIWQGGIDIYDYVIDADVIKLSESQKIKQPKSVVPRDYTKNVSIFDDTVPIIFQDSTRRADPKVLEFLDEEGIQYHAMPALP